MTQDIVVIGAGGFGRETLDVIEAINDAAHALLWGVVGVIDDSPSEAALDHLTARGHRHLGTLDVILAGSGAREYVIGIGAPRTRAAIARKLDEAGWRAAPPLIHPAAVIGSASVMGNGAVVCGGVQLSTNTRLGRHVHLNPGSVIGHDSRLEEFVSVNPGAVISGDVEIAPRVLIGANATILQGLTIGPDATVGAAACVTRAVAPGATVVGVPARPRGGGS